MSTLTWVRMQHMEILKQKEKRLNLGGFVIVKKNKPLLEH